MAKSKGLKIAATPPPVVSILDPDGSFFPYAAGTTDLDVTGFVRPVGTTVTLEAWILNPNPGQTDYRTFTIVTTKTIWDYDVDGFEDGNIIVFTASISVPGTTPDPSYSSWAIIGTADFITLFRKRRKGHKR